MDHLTGYLPPLLVAEPQARQVSGESSPSTGLSHCLDDLASHHVRRRSTLLGRPKGRSSNGPRICHDVNGNAADVLYKGCGSNLIAPVPGASPLISGM